MGAYLVKCEEVVKDAEGNVVVLETSKYSVSSAG